jgi:hypothetical protein
VSTERPEVTDLLCSANQSNDHFQIDRKDKGAEHWIDRQHKAILLEIGEREECYHNGRENIAEWDCINNSRRVSSMTTMPATLPIATMENGHQGRTVFSRYYSAGILRTMTAATRRAGKVRLATQRGKAGAG